MCIRDRTMSLAALPGSAARRPKGPRSCAPISQRPEELARRESGEEQGPAAGTPREAALQLADD
eukprot:709592-Lingulodinium_polyedra.AAC.1